MATAALREIPFRQDFSLPEVRRQEVDVIEELSALIKSCGLTFDRWSQTSCTLEQQRNFSWARMRCLQLIAEKGSIMEIKKATLDHLLLILSFDPHQDLTANELPKFTKAFVSLMENIEDEVPSIQSKFARVYGLAIDNMVCHYHEGTLGVIQEETKKSLQQAPEILKRLNKIKENPDIEFAVEYALEGAKLLESEVTKKDKLLRAGIAIFQMGVNLYKGNFGEALRTLYQLLSEYDIKKNWFQASLVLKKLTRIACFNREAFYMLRSLIEKTRSETGVLHTSKVNWKYLYTIVISLKEIALHSESEEIQKEAMDLLLFYQDFKGFQYRDNNWKIRYGTCLALEEIWKEGSGFLQGVASKALLQGNATEENLQVQNILRAITEDSAIRQSWRIHVQQSQIALQKEEEQLKRYTTTFQKDQDKLQEKENYLLAQQQVLHQQEERLQAQQVLLLQKQNSRIPALEQNLSQLQMEKKEPSLQEQEVIRKEDEIRRLEKELNLTNADLRGKQQLFDRKNETMQRGLFAKKEELSMQQREIKLQKEALEKQNELFQERERQLQSQILAFHSRFETLQQIEADFAVAAKVQRAEYQRREQEVQKALQKPERDKIEKSFESQVDIGFYLSATCKIKDCQLAGQSVWINKNTGEFNVNRECNFTQCSSCKQDFEDINTIAIYAMNYSWEGQKSTGEKAHGEIKSTEVSHFVFEDLSEWRYLSVTVLPT